MTRFLLAALILGASSFSVTAQPSSSPVPQLMPVTLTATDLQKITDVIGSMPIRDTAYANEILQVLQEREREAQVSKAGK
jgi:hypothetical protein